MKSLYLILLLIVFSLSCRQTKVSVEPVVVEPRITKNDTLTNRNNNYIRERPLYRETEALVNELEHTKLDLKFDYQQKSVTGTAEITLKVHFYATDTLILDAREFEIRKISLLKPVVINNLKFDYNKNEIKIYLDKKYKKDDEYTVFIDYTAFPERIKNTGSRAITGNKGLYFIDADTDNPQIWTQGQTESNSCWFPTIDAPNQKMSQEIYLTVDTRFKTLSNGTLVTQLLNDDGTRTDYWKQEKKHAPYLAMIAVGDFEIIKDYWRDIPVFLYVERQMKDKVSAVFGNTVEIIEFFSRKLNYDYPWDKYHQVIVRRFVSGAMENTGATVFGDFVLYYNNEISRMNYEGIVAHELSHHWFGNLVTCESWANLPLNEAFASYMEYAWIEYKYGIDEADRYLSKDKQMYMYTSDYQNHDMIWFGYKKPDDMFDNHSYEKGALILHMLRKTVGDNAFWKALTLYLNKYQYKTAEIHDLRLVFEEVTGRDLNWFFNQWFFDKGYPDLNVNYSFDTDKMLQSVRIYQVQNKEFGPLYKLPVKLDFYFGDSIVTKAITLDKELEIFAFKFEQKPDLVIFDSENSLLSKVKENKSVTNYIFQLKNVKSYTDKMAAIRILSANIKNSEVEDAIFGLLDEEFWEYKTEAIKILKIGKGHRLYDNYTKKLEFISKNDDNSTVRKAAENKLKSLK